MPCGMLSAAGGGTQPADTRQKIAFGRNDSDHPNGCAKAGCDRRR